MQHTGLPNNLRNSVRLILRAAAYSVSVMEAPLAALDASLLQL